MATEEFEKEVLQKLDELIETAEKVDPQIKGELGGLRKEAEMMRDKIDSLDRTMERILKCETIKDYFSEEEISTLNEVCSWYNFWGEKGHLDKLRESINKLEERVEKLDENLTEEINDAGALEHRVIDLDTKRVWMNERLEKLEEEIENLKLYNLGKGFYINDKFVPYINGEISDIHLGGGLGGQVITSDGAQPTIEDIQGENKGSYPESELSAFKRRVKNTIRTLGLMTGFSSERRLFRALSMLLFYEDAIGEDKE